MILKYKMPCIKRGIFIPFIEDKLVTNHKPAIQHAAQDVEVLPLKPAGSKVFRTE